MTALVLSSYKAVRRHQVGEPIITFFHSADGTRRATGPRAGLYSFKLSFNILFLLQGQRVRSYEGLQAAKEMLLGVPPTSKAAREVYQSQRAHELISPISAIQVERVFVPLRAFCCLELSDIQVGKCN